MQEWLKGSERVEVHFGLFPGDSRVLNVSYDAGGPSPSAAEIRAELERRYGRAHQAMAGWAKWCRPACGAEAVVMDVGGSRVGLGAPDALTTAGALNRRVDAAARALAGLRPGSF